MTERVEGEDLRQTPADERPSDWQEDIDQDTVGPIEGDEAIDDDTDYRHTPASPTTR